MHLPQTHIPPAQHRSHASYIRFSTVADSSIKRGLVGRLCLVPQREPVIRGQVQPVVERDILRMEHRDPPLE
eukprot:3197674-Prymnesium_polylepis.2